MRLFVMDFPAGIYSKNKYQFKKRLAAFGFKWVRDPGGDYTDGEWQTTKGDVIDPTFSGGSGGPAKLRMRTSNDAMINIMRNFCEEVGAQFYETDEETEQQSFDYYLEQYEKAIKDRNQREADKWLKKMEECD